MSNERHLDYWVRAFCAYTVYLKPRDDKTCFLSNNDVTGTEVIVQLAFVLTLTLVA